MNKLGLIFRTWTFLYSYEKRSILWGVAVTLTGLYAAVTVWLSKQIIDALVSPADALLAGVPNAFLFGGIYGLVMLLHGFIGAYSTIEILNIRDRIAGHVDRLLMDKVGGTPDIKDFEIPEYRDRIHLASAGGRALPIGFSGSLEVLRSLATVVGLLVILLDCHFFIAAVVFLPAIPLFYAQVKVRKHTYSALVHMSPTYRQMSYYIKLMFSDASAKEMRVYRSGGFFLEKYRRVAEEIFEFARDHRKKAMVATVVWGCVAAVGIGGAYLYIIYLAMMKTITIGDLVMYSGAIFFAGSSIRALVQAAAGLWAKMLEVDAFFAYLDHEPEEPAWRGNGGVLRAAASGKEWMIDNVSYAYPGSEVNVLEQVSFSIGAGEKIAIVGLNGAGKTTLLKLMLGLLDPDQGSIAFRGRDLRAWDRAKLREEFGVVFQDFSRFKLTLYENIALAAKSPRTDGMDRELVYAAAKRTGVDRIAQTAPDGYDTLLAKEFLHGTNLSGGQWQKVALARAFLRDAHVVFLDEPTASLDAKAEQAIFEQFLDLAQESTAILVSHRFSITPLVDRVLVLEQGRLVEEGTHDQLMKRGGRYARMYKTQADMYWAKPA